MNRGDESAEVGGDALRHFAGGDVVVTGVEDDQTRLVLEGDPRREMHGVGQVRAAETAIERGHPAEGLRQVPAADAGAADEDDAIFRRWRLAVALLEGGDVL